MTALKTPLSQVSFVSLDVETTGLNARRDEIVEIGAVKVRNGAVLDTFETLVHIRRTIPFGARQVHGISNDMLVGKPRIGEALDSFLEFSQGSVLVEHSHRAFDIAFLEHAHGAALSQPYINTCTLSRRLFPHMRKHSLEECCRRMKVVNERPHRALGDARATADLLNCLLALCISRYPLLEDLVAAASVER